MLDETIIDCFLYVESGEYSDLVEKALSKFSVSHEKISDNAYFFSCPRDQFAWDFTSPCEGMIYRIEEQLKTINASTRCFSAPCSAGYHTFHSALGEP
uniref:hypothetical protein n=1 Tax=Ndongobacter massiliensis TaxID=1871025 RepID=UPI0012FF136B|nr:hypothetical protein [Ndongobacter massiliensis]